MITQVGATASSTYQAAYSATGTAQTQAKQATGTVEDSAYTLSLSAEYTASKTSQTQNTDAMQTIKDQLDQSTSAMRDMVEKLITQQVGDGSASFSLTLQITGLTQTSSPVQETASSSQASDSEWGIEAVSDKIVNFAKSLSGGDASKMAVLKDAIDKGFAQAQKTLGGKLPDISSKTYDAVMTKLDEWANGGSTSTSAGTNTEE